MLEVVEKPDTMHIAIENYILHLCKQVIAVTGNEFSSDKQTTSFTGQSNEIRSLVKLQQTDEIMSSNT